MKKLISALRDLAASIYAARDSVPAEIAKQLDHAGFALEVLAHIVAGKSILRSFGAPGDWGYGTPIGAGVHALLRDPHWVDPCIEWHYLPELPEVETSVLIAVENPDSDEVLIGHYAGDGTWWQQPHDVDLYIYAPVYAWAHAPTKPVKKGGAS